MEDRPDTGARAPRSLRDVLARIPRSRAEWRARMKDAARFDEPVNPPLVWGRDLAHRMVLLTIVLLLTAAFAALMATPVVAVFGRSVDAIADRFAIDAGEAVLPKIAQRSVVVDRKGKVLATLTGEENRIIVPLSRVPKHARNAVLAIEDARFYEHNGVDLQGLVRAAILNFRAGGIRQGGSTITQQLVKNTIVGTERTIDRKIKEAKLAVQLEEEMSKDQILELYLNETYFGRGYYGIGAASEYYFGKDVSKLTLAEGALLAGIIRTPTSFEPIANPERALARRTTVLKRMLDEGMITEPQYARANRAKLGAKRHPLPPPKTPYFVEYVKLQILRDERFGATGEERERALFAGGLRIETTLDLKLQKAAQRASDQVLNLPDDPSSAVVSIEPGTGAVRAMVGGRDFEESKFNLAVQAERQPGSTFKPVVLAAAIEEGLAPSLTMRAPSPLRIREADGKLYPVKNYDKKDYGFIDMRTATEQSINTYYVQLIDRVGPEKVVDMGERLGITTELGPFLSLALGTVAVSPLEMATVYATLAANGQHCEPYGITRVADAAGNTLLRNTPTCERRIPAQVAAQTTDILRGVIERGTGRTNGQIGRPAAGKTGTTDEYVDSWFAGYTPQFATVVWLGFPEDTTRSLYNIHGLPRVYGGSLPAMIWNRYMTRAHEKLPVERFPEPAGVDDVEVPGVVGRPFADARETVVDAGFTVRRVVVAAMEDPGIVVSQTPPGGSSAAPGRLVTLRVSDGSVPRPACSNGEDDDGDGKVDDDDLGCTGADDDDEKDPPKCANGIDDDGDGKVDGDDPGCSGSNDNDEKDPPKCSNGKDDDGDGKKDYPDDPGCSSPNDNSESPDPSPSPSPSGGGG